MQWSTGSYHSLVDRIYWLFAVGSICKKMKWVQRFQNFGIIVIEFIQCRSLP